MASNKCVSANQLSKRINVSWNTADAHLKKLVIPGVVKKGIIHRHHSKRIFWRINRRMIPWITDGNAPFLKILCV